MSEYIKSGSLHGADLFREVGPVAPYPRINPHQPKREQYPRQHADQHSGQDSQARRRFISMRELVDKLKESCQIARVDYQTAELEMHNQGLAIAEEALISQLLQLKIPLGAIDDLFRQIRQQRSGLTLAPGRKLTADNVSLFPVNTEGLSEYCLTFSNLQLRPERQEARIVEEINNNGRFTSESDRLRLTFRRLLPGSESPEDGNLLQLDIQVLVGAIEIDDAGRRAILYPRSKAKYALYADKQINLSI